MRLGVVARPRATPITQKASGGMGFHQYVNLVRELTVTNFKLKYTGSVLGYLWSLLKPLAYFGVLYLIFVELFHQKQANFPLQLLVAIVLFTFFSESTTAGLGSIAANGNLIRRARFPLSALVLALSTTALMTMLINLSLIVAIAGPTGRLQLGWNSLAAVALLAELWLLALGIGMLLASAFVFFRDLGHIWEVVSQMLLYGSAVVFPATAVPESWRGFFFLNPLAQVIEDMRHILVTTAAPSNKDLLGPWFPVPYAVTAGLFVVGLWLFWRLAPYFAENV